MRAYAMAVAGMLAIANAALPARADRNPPDEDLPVTILMAVPGESSFSDSITADQFRDYVVPAKAGQNLTASLQADVNVYFSVLPPGGEEAIYVGSADGGPFRARLLSDGDYTLRVYMLSGKVEQGDTANFTLDVRVRE